MSTLFSKIKIHLNPHQYWILVLRVFFGICIVIVMGSFYVLYQIKAQHIFQVKRSAQIGTINPDLLQKVQDGLNHKAQVHASIEENPPQYPDPSL